MRPSFIVRYLIVDARILDELVGVDAKRAQFFSIGLGLFRGGIRTLRFCPS